MPRTGSGTYVLPAGNPVVPATTILSSWANSTLNDIASALSQSLAKDGQTVPTANLPLGGFKFTGVGPATATDQYATAGQVQDQLLVRLTTLPTSTAADYQATLPLGTTSAAFQPGAVLIFTPNVTNTGITTISINGETPALPIGTFLGEPTPAGYLVANEPYYLRRYQHYWIAENVNEGIGGGYVRKAGDTMTGDLGFSYASPTITYSDGAAGVSPLTIRTSYVNGTTRLALHPHGTETSSFIQMWNTADASGQRLDVFALATSVGLDSEGTGGIGTGLPLQLRVDGQPLLMALPIRPNNSRVITVGATGNTHNYTPNTTSLEVQSPGTGGAASVLALCPGDVAIGQMSMTTANGTGLSISTNAGNWPIRLSPALVTGMMLDTDLVTLGIAAGEAMRVTAQRNVGIGTTTPTDYGAGARSLEVHSTGAGAFAVVRVSNVEGGGLEIIAAAFSSVFRSVGPVQFQPGGVVRMDVKATDVASAPGLAVGGGIGANRFAQNASVLFATPSQTVTLDFMAGGLILVPNGTHTLVYANLPDGNVIFGSTTLEVAGSFNSITTWPANTSWEGGVKPSIAGGAVVDFKCRASNQVFASIFWRA